MGRANASSRGFTLIETLIAMVLLSLLMISGALAYDYFMQNWQRNKGLADKTLERHQLLMLVQKVTLNTFPKLIAGENGRNGFYFLGRENGFTAVSKISVQNPSAGAVYRIFQEPDGAGGFQLVYEEAVLENIAFHDIEQNLPFNFRRVLYANVPSIDFNYRGYASLNERNMTLAVDMGETFELEWFQDYDGMQRFLHPQAIQINLSGFHWFIEVPDAVEEILSRYSSDV